jgi:predicted Ser/Thr protein kinase
MKVGIVMNERQRMQLEFHESNQNIIVGNELQLPLSIEELKLIDEKSKWVVESFKSGLTAVVYHLEINGNHYNLKKKRPESLVKNIDGQTSFLNEVQRRKDFEALRLENKIIDKGIVKTIYANYREGIMLSEWIDGSTIESVTEDIVSQLFALTLELEKSGIMEWDLCKGNMLVSEQGLVKLFDFGYAYRYNPLKSFNSEGLEIPMFNSVERFETRFFMPYLLELESKNSDLVIEQYRMVKEQAIKIFKKKAQWLLDVEADPVLLDVCKKQLLIWEEGISTEEGIRNLYKLESIRSYVLDIHDDISGKSCTKATILKVDKVIEMINDDYDFMCKNDGFLWDDIGKSKVALLKKYQQNRELVIDYQIKS